MVRLNVIAPFDFSSTFLDDFNRFTVRDSWEGKARNFDCNRVLFLRGTILIDDVNQVLIVGSNLTPNVVDHSLLYAHDVFIIHPSAFNIKGDEFVQVTVGIVLLCSEGRSNLKDTLQSTQHGKLFVQLWRLRKVGIGFEIFHREQVGSAF